MMKIFACFSILALALSTAAAAQMGVMADDQAVRSLITGMTAEWDKADAKAIAARWRTDGDMVVSDGSYAKNPSEIQGWFAKQFMGVFKGSKLTSTVSSVRFLNADAAIVNFDWTISGIGGSGSRSGKGTVVAAKEQGTWKIAVWRSMVPTKIGPTG
jgi:uncharacterized protein (TIGR02246 family)